MTDLEGSRVGRYLLKDFLGRGGMAEVYRAEDTVLARSVAIKLILPAFASDPAFLERFLREAQLVASLDHPHVVPVYDFGEEDGRPFLVMPYIPGGSLASRLSGRPIPMARSAAWLHQLGSALDAAHAAGVLHRDVKPANVLLGRDERLLLSDFGIARALESSTRLTATGVLVGTPAFMAPELAEGEAATAASDRYVPRWRRCLCFSAFSPAKPPTPGSAALRRCFQASTRQHSGSYRRSLERNFQSFL